MRSSLARYVHRILRTRATSKRSGAIFHNQTASFHADTIRLAWMDFDQKEIAFRDMFVPQVRQPTQCHALPVECSLVRKSKIIVGNAQSGRNVVNGFLPYLKVLKHSHSILTTFSDKAFPASSFGANYDEMSTYSVCPFKPIFFWTKL